jgi:phage terminase large subunit
LPDLFDTVPDSRNHRITSDSARPETISLMNKYGFNTTSCYKWKNSKIGFIRDGIEFIRKFERIHIHTRCVRTADEFRHYSYKKDKVGNILPVPKDSMNHTIDALRYSLEDLIQAGGGTDWVAVIGE